MTFCCLHVKLAVLFLDRVTRGYSLHCHQKTLSVASPSPADRAGAPLHRPCDLCAVGFAESGAVALGHYARDLHDRESCHPSCIVGSPYLCPSLFSLELDCLGPGADRFWFHLCGRLDCFAAGDENRSRAVSGSLPPYGVSGDCSGFGCERRRVRGGGIPTQAERAKRLARADGRERNDSAATARRRIETGARNSADALAKQSAAAGGCPDCWGLATCPRSQRDYFDVIRLDEKRLGICMGDVAGKGITAALLMANLQASVRAFATADATPEVVCTKLNKFLCANIASGKFVTFFYAIFDSETRTLIYENAGHSPGLLIRVNGKVEGLGGGGAVLGGMPARVYQNAAVQLEPLDKLLLSTDGITEAENSKLEEFGEQRLLGAAQVSDASALDTQRTVMQKVTEFCGGNFRDDATLLVLRVV